MLEIGSLQTRDCTGTSRRCFLKAGMTLPFLPGLLQTSAAFGAEPAKARSVMLVWLNGGPSHLDLFDPKPLAPDQFRGPFGTIATRTSGLRFTELLPKLAMRSDKFSVVRTNINHHGGHRQACGCRHSSHPGTRAIAGYGGIYRARCCDRLRGNACWRRLGSTHCTQYRDLGTVG